MTAAVVPGRVLLRHGLVVDGRKNGQPGVADVLLSDGNIAAVEPGGISDAEAQVVDCTGLVVSPGFIDIHTHSDLTRFSYPDSSTRVLQGITTEVIGNCGFSPAPVAGDESHIRQLLSLINPCDQAIEWRTVPEYLARLEQTPAATNVAPLLGHGMLRATVIPDMTAPAGPAQLEQMIRLLEEALEQGMWGISLGLMYSPGESATGDELSALAQVVARRSRLVASHMRAYDQANLLPAVEEMANLASHTGCAMQLSHLRVIFADGTGQIAQVLDAIDRWGSAGVDLTADAYPYLAGHTNALQLFSPPIRRKGPAAITNLAQTHPGQLVEDLAHCPATPQDIIIVRTGETPTPEVGHTLDHIAKSARESWQEVLVKMILEHAAAVDVLIFGSNENDTLTALTHPLVMIGSDGFSLGLDHESSQPHPRSIGTFPKSFSWLRKAGMELPEIIYKATGQPAQRLGLAGRGVVSVGAAADVVVFDPNQLEDRASYQAPLVPPVGIHHVFVNGIPVVWDHAATAHRPGRLLRAV